MSPLTSLRATTDTPFTSLIKQYGTLNTVQTKPKNGHLRNEDITAKPSIMSVLSALPQLSPPVGPCGHALSGPTAYLSPCAYCSLYSAVVDAADGMNTFDLRDAAQGEAYEDAKSLWKLHRLELANNVYQQYGTDGCSHHCDPAGNAERALEKARRRREEIGDGQTTEDVATNTSAPSQPTNFRSSTVQRPSVTFSDVANIGRHGDQHPHRDESSYRQRSSFFRQPGGQYQPGRWTARIGRVLKNKSGKGIEGWAEWEQHS